MADLLSSQVTLAGGSTNLAGDEFFAGEKARAVFARRIKLTGGTCGSAANKIGAAALGFKKLVDCSSLWDANASKLYRAGVDPVNNNILLAAVASDTPADVTHVSSFITVWGT